MIRSRYLTAFLPAALASALLLSTSCGSNPVNGNGGSNSNSNTALTNTPTPTPSAGPTPACPPNGDADIIAFIGKGVEDDKGLNARRRYINWDSKGCEIHLVGATGTKANYENLIKLAENAPSRGTIDRQYLSDGVDSPVGCPTNWVTCNDICIPPDQKCNSRDVTPVLGAPTRKP